MRPQSRRLAAALLLCLAAAPGLWWQDRPNEGERTGNLRVAPLPVEGSLRRADLKLDGAWLLTSDDRRFSGYSALVLNDNGRLRAYSDTSRWLEFDRPDQPRRRAHRYGGVQGYDPRGHNDLEAAAHDPASGLTWLAFEHLNSIRRIGPSELDFASAEPAAMADFRNNGGAEALVRLSDGRFLVIAESADWDSPRRRKGLIFAQDPVENPAATSFTISPPLGYDPTDAALLPDGRVLILLRGLYPLGWPPFNSKLLVGDPAQLREGALWPLREVADLRGLVPRENYEGLAVERSAEGIELWLIADANRNVLVQRTLLVKLIWAEPAAAGPRLRLPPGQPS